MCVAVAGHRVGQQTPVAMVPIVHPTPAPVSGLAVGLPYFHNGLMKANVSWTLPSGESSLHHCGTLVLLHKEHLTSGS